MFFNHIPGHIRELQEYGGGTGMNLQQMKYVVTISEQGSFSKASQILYITQPTLSNEVKKKKKELVFI